MSRYYNIYDYAGRLTTTSALILTQLSDHEVAVGIAMNTWDGPTGADMKANKIPLQRDLVELASQSMLTEAGQWLNRWASLVNEQNKRTFDRAMMRHRMFALDPFRAGDADQPPDRPLEIAVPTVDSLGTDAAGQTLRPRVFVHYTPMQRLEGTSWKVTYHA